jgi:4-hydroxybenzoate polyprenyltransferase
LLIVSGFFVFSFLSGVVYIINDIADAEADRNHPEKCNRPIASGKIGVKSAIIYALFLCIISLTSAYFISTYFLIISLIYLIINLCYSFKLKHIVLIDISVISIGFILRALAGTAIIQVYASSWFLICIFFGALLLAVSKRRYEFIKFRDTLSMKRKVLENYSEKLLDQIIGISSAGAIISFSLYTIHPQGKYDSSTFTSDYMPLTILFVVYGILRYLYIVYKKGEGGNPEKILFKDKSILATVFLFGLFIIIIALWEKLFK